LGGAPTSLAQPQTLPKKIGRSPKSKRAKSMPRWIMGEGGLGEGPANLLRKHGVKIFALLRLETHLILVPDFL